MKGKRIWRWAAVAAPLAIGLWVVVAWKGEEHSRPQSPPEAAREAPPANPHQPQKQPAPSAGNLEGSLLDQMNGKASGDPSAANVESSSALEQEFNTILKSNERLAELKEEVTAARRSGKNEGVEARMIEGRGLINRMNQQLGQLEQNLAAARKARPDDPAAQWLTGELLLFVGGEPNEIRPYFQRAVDGGVDRARAFAGLANVEYEAGEYQKAYQTSLKALEKDPRSQYVWGAYSKAALGVERFGEVLDRMEKTFPRNAPGWAEAIRGNARDLSARWNEEQTRRKSEDQANNLPVVKLTIEHRRYVPGPDRSTPPTLATGARGDVEIELF
ncbi:MAG TPA: hypothetical protein VG672_17520, partial [Bryobacteraceae bacterium]|nr:hypothetical protein [Bryobacteraceae bacterium]